MNRDPDVFPPNHVFKIPPFMYCYVLNTDTQIVRTVLGPITLTTLENEKMVLGPEKMVVIPPKSFCIVENPVVKVDGVVQFDASGLAILRHGDSEVRLSQDPFPLYPGEKLAQGVKELPMIQPNTAFRLLAMRDVLNEKGEVTRKAGEEWLESGPTTYLPHPAVRMVYEVKATILKPNEALRLKARSDFVDRDNVRRKAGDEWLVRKTGAFIPGVEEIVVETCRPTVLTAKNALHLRALASFVDIFGKHRKVGDEWLVTSEDSEVHIPDVYEQVVSQVSLTTMNSRQWAVIHNPVDKNTGKNALGTAKLLRGEASFFLQPGEVLNPGPENVYVLEEQHALSVLAVESFEEELEDRQGRKTRVRRNAGDRWLVYGPKEFWPPLEVEVQKRVHAFFGIEALHFYLFRPDAAIVTAISVLVLLLAFLILRL